MPLKKFFVRNPRTNVSTRIFGKSLDDALKQADLNPADWQELQLPLEKTQQPEKD